jgi:putative transposase
MSHAYSEIHLHVIWRTKNSERLLVAEVEVEAHAAIRRKAQEHRGVIVRALNGIEDHVHLAVTIPPTLLISEFIGQVKGASSHAVNGRGFVGRPYFAWQSGYGVLSFSTKGMGWVVKYIDNQKAHHANSTTVALLERTEEDEPAAPLPS